MRKCANIYPYMRRPLVIYDFATAPFWISLYMRKIWFLFYQCSLNPKALVPLNHWHKPVRKLTSNYQYLALCVCDQLERSVGWCWGGFGIVWQWNLFTLSGCKDIYEEGRPNMRRDAQIFSHIWGGRYSHIWLCNRSSFWISLFMRKILFSFLPVCAVLRSTLYCTAQHFILCLCALADAN